MYIVPTNGVCWTSFGFGHDSLICTKVAYSFMVCMYLMQQLVTDVFGSVLLLCISLPMVLISVLVSLLMCSVPALSSLWWTYRLIDLTIFWSSPGLVVLWFTSLYWCCWLVCWSICCLFVFCTGLGILWCMYWLIDLTVFWSSPDFVVFLDVHVSGDGVNLFNPGMCARISTDVIDSGWYVDWPFIPVSAHRSRSSLVVSWLVKPGMRPDLL